MSEFYSVKIPDPWEGKGTTSAILVYDGEKWVKVWDADEGPNGDEIAFAE